MAASDKRSDERPATPAASVMSDQMSGLARRRLLAEIILRESSAPEVFGALGQASHPQRRAGTANAYKPHAAQAKLLAPGILLGFEAKTACAQMPVRLTNRSKS